MISKIVAYCFILIAGFISLAHDIVPHHHHETEAVEHSQTNSSHSDKDHHSNFPEHEHHHGNHLLVIRQVFASPFGTGIPNVSDDNCIDYQWCEYFFLDNSGIFYVYSTPDDKIPIKDIPEKISNTILLSYGLRAPPIV